MKELHLTIVTPEQTMFDGPVTQVTLPGEAGRFQVLPRHAALISSLVAGDMRYTAGDMRYTAGGELRSLRLKGGFVEVNDNNVLVCAEL